MYKNLKAKGEAGASVNDDFLQFINPQHFT